MLTQLTIQNFSLIDTLALDFAKGLTIFTGETGAGKSILIDALRYVLGERFSTTYIRDASSPCLLEAVFELSKNDLAHYPPFTEYLSEEEPLLIIQRTITPEGKSKNKINGLTVTLAQLNELGNRLVDFHGPHDHQLLFSQESHIEILDRLCKLLQKEAYCCQYADYLALKQKLHELRECATSRERDLDFLTHQIRELEQVQLDRNKYEEVMQEEKRINNMENLHECTAQLISSFENEDAGITERLQQAFSLMRTLNAIDESTEPFNETLTQIQDLSEQLLSELKDYHERLSFQPDEARKIIAQCDSYNDLLRKYGPTIEDAAAFYIEAKEKHERLSNIEESDTELTKNIASLERQLSTLAQQMSTERKKKASTLKKTIEAELSELGIKNVQFECRISEIALNQKGCDNVTFYISPNLGEQLKPLADIVSSGEAARVMLALKKALIAVDPIPVLIFDEIDAQIGGRLGTITGTKLKQLSQNRQVILITHLPQIASFADEHIKIEKKVAKGRTLTSATKLTSDNRRKELAQMMSGEKESHISLKHAEELLEKAKK